MYSELEVPIAEGRGPGNNGIKLSSEFCIYRHEATEIKRRLVLPLVASTSGNPNLISPIAN